MIIGRRWHLGDDVELRQLAVDGLTDAEIFRRLKPTRPFLSQSFVAQRRRLLGLKRTRGGDHMPPRPEGDQRHCLGCGKPFRSKHKHNRLCENCTRSAKRSAA